MTMGRRRKLKLPDPPDSSPGLPLGRLLVTLAMVGALVFLIVRLVGMLRVDEGSDLAAAPAPEVPEVRLVALENVQALVQIDGQVVFEGTLNGGVDRSWPAGQVAVVELGDLTRATVHYDGQRVEPLGRLSTPRRLEFVDDL